MKTMLTMIVLYNEISQIERTHSAAERHSQRCNSKHENHAGFLERS